MGKLALAAKITHVPSMYLSELPGPHQGCRAGGDRRPQGDRPPLPRARRRHHRGVRRALAGQQRLPHQLRAALRGHLHQQRAAALHQEHALRVPGQSRAGPPDRRHGQRDGREEPRPLDTTLELEYGTLVPMRYMNADQHFKVVSVSGWCDWHDLHDSGRFGPAVRRAIEEQLRRHGGGVRQRLAVAPLRRQRPRARVHAQGLRPVPRAGGPPRGGAVAGRATGRPSSTCCRCTPTNAGAKATCTTRRCCWACWAGTATTAPVEIVTPYFGSSGTGQINAIFPVTPLP